MANIMNQVLPVAGLERPLQSVQPERPSGDKFSDHLDRTLQDQRAHDTKVGLKQRESRRAAAERIAGREDRPEKVSSEGDQDGTVAEILALFMQDLQQMAQDNGLGVGEWVTTLDDGQDFLPGLATNAGMSEMDLIALTERFQTEDGSLDLPSFFQSLQEHFEGFQATLPVLVPETELPQLESLLTKMGMSQEQLTQITESMLVGDEQIDLGKLNEALLAFLNNEKEGEQTLPVTLSESEVEQLQDLLGKIGLDLGKQLELLPEPLLGKEVVLSLERLQNILDEGITQAQMATPRVDLAAFLKNLESVMQSATFVDQSAGIAPLVQNSLVDVYKNLVAMLDDMQRRFDEGLAQEDSLFTEDVDKWRAGVAERIASLTGMDVDDIKVQTGRVVEGSVLPDTSSSSAQTTTTHTGISPTSQFQSVDQAISVQGGSDQPAPNRHFSSQQQQQIFNQLSLAVARGMKSGEHHLTLRLHPVELGDVKVDLVLKGGEISAHFNIASSRVKETLEASMDEFRQEMEQKGINIGALNVSVGGQDDPTETFQRFEMAWSGERLQAETLADIPDAILYHHGLKEQYANPEQGVNLFV